ncbi:MAG: MurR/RpiR family transcriptional regulator [Microcella pacifica]|uniref:MurR/RpiR family transcriptional regulator n=1 Tax=Microcella TaxID=337004 RepID=UPI0015CF521A|nr:MurR/RpiR family transcriptional regulator [Microcella indica]
MWSGSADAPPTARIAMLAPSLHPTERRVAESIASDVEAAIERTAQDVADLLGVGRASVIRTSQSLGYSGYQQLRVALVRELALGSQTTSASEGADGTVMGALRTMIERFSDRLGHTLSALTEESVEQFVRVVDESQRVLVVANGLSLPLGLDLALRLISAGRPAEYLPDTIGQQISATQLGAGSACVVVTGSGANRASLEVMTAARESGATVLVITCFPQSAAAKLADAALIVAPIDDTFRDELVHTSRAALMLVTEFVVELLVSRRGDRARVAQAATLSMLSRSLSE